MHACLQNQPKNTSVLPTVGWQEVAGGEAVLRRVVGGRAGCPGSVAGCVVMVTLVLVTLRVTQLLAPASVAGSGCFSSTSLEPS